jgi:predicted PurR-regulated permease PerM
MQTAKSKAAATDALVGLWTVGLTSFVIATLYFARDFLIPLALAALLTFLLSPLVTRIERWLGRIAAVLLVVARFLRLRARRAGCLPNNWSISRRSCRTIR